MKPFLFITTLWLAAAGARAELNVVATLPDFGAIAREVGGDKVKVTSIARGTEDLHFVDARPSFIRVLNQADVLLESGAELEVGWLPPLLQGARNKKIMADAPGHVILSRGVRLLDASSGPIDRSMGDVHPGGNPHYTMDPANVKTIAARLAEAFSRIDSANAPEYQANAKKFTDRLDQKMAEWTRLLEPYRGTKVVTYHKSYDYFLNYFGFELAGTLEPKPGLEPSPSYVNSLIPKLKAQNAKLLMVEPFRPRKTPQHIAETIGAKLLVLPSSVGGNERAADYISFMDYNVNQVLAALKEHR